MKTLLPLALLLAAPIAATGFQDIAALDRRVANALGAPIGQPGGAAAPIDPRLHLAACPDAVAIDPPAAGALALRCPALGWRIRVPLMRFAGQMQAPAQGSAPGAAPSGYMQPAYQARPDPVVRRGDPVDLVAGTASFSVSVAAVAQEDGAPGARIRVRAENDGKPQQTVFAEVIEAGRVRLPGFNR